MAACGSKSEPPAKQDETEQPDHHPGAVDAAAVETRTFDSAGAAVGAILEETEPRVVAFGEFHELAGSRVSSALSRFHTSVLPTLVDRTSDLILEFWARDSCGEKSEQVNQDVQQVTERPASTGNEVLALLRDTKKAGIQNHVLLLGCDDYDSILDTDGGVDYEKLLLLVTQKLYRQGEQVLAVREKKGPPAPGRELLVLYGGSLHNDLEPDPSTRDLTYAPRLAERTGSGLVEIDLYVPEYIEGNQLVASRDWYPLFEKQVSRDRVVLIERGPASYILILRRGLVKKSP